MNWFNDRINDVGRTFNNAGRALQTLTKPLTENKREKNVTLAKNLVRKSTASTGAAHPQPNTKPTAQQKKPAKATAQHAVKANVAQGASTAHNNNAAITQKPVPKQLKTTERRLMAAGGAVGVVAASAVGKQGAARGLSAGIRSQLAKADQKQAAAKPHEDKDPGWKKGLLAEAQAFTPLGSFTRIKSFIPGQKLSEHERLVLRAQEDVAKSVILGDAHESKTLSGNAAKIGVSFIPIVGQVAAARDVAINGWKALHAKTDEERNSALMGAGLAAVAFIPFGKLAGFAKKPIVNAFKTIFR
jgi:hypothetical protein